MRKSLQKTPHFALSSRPGPLRAALLSAGVSQRPALKRNGSAASRGAAAPAAITAGGEQLLAARVRLLEALVSRSDVSDCTQYALQWLRDSLELIPTLCLLKPTGEEALFTVGAHGLSGTSASRFTLSLEDWNNPLVTAFSSR